MDQYAYLAHNETGDFFVGPEETSDPEAVVLGARSRGHALIQVYRRAPPDAAFRPLFASPAFPLPPTIVCFRLTRLGRPSFPAIFAPSDWKEVEILLRSGEVRGQRLRLPPRIKLETESVVQRARQAAELLIPRAFGNFDRLRNEPPTPPSPEEVDALISRVRATRGRTDDVTDPLSEFLDNKTRGRRLQKQKTLTGAEVLVPNERDFPGDGRAVDFLGNLPGHLQDPCPVSRMLCLTIQEVLRKGGRGFRFSPKPDDPSVGPDLLFSACNVELILADGRMLPFESPPRRLMPELRDWIVAAAGASPFENPPFEFSRVLDLAGRSFRIDLRLGLLPSGETVQLTWVPEVSPRGGEDPRETRTAKPV